MASRTQRWYPVWWGRWILGLLLLASLSGLLAPVAGAHEEPTATTEGPTSTALSTATSTPVPPIPTPTQTLTPPPPPTAVPVPPTSTQSAPTATENATPVPSPSPSAVWTPFVEDFETGDSRHWDRVDGLVVQPDVVLDGAYAARSSSDGTQPSFARTLLTPAQPELYLRLRFQVLSRGSNPYSLLLLRDDANHAVVGLYLASNGDLTLRIVPANTRTPSRVQVDDGRWHEVRLHVQVGPGGSPGTVDVWLDGAPLEQLSLGVSLGAAPFGRLELGEPSLDRRGDVVFDGVRVDTQPIPADPRFQPATTNPERAAAAEGEVAAAAETATNTPTFPPTTPTGPRVTRLVLINADTEQDLGELTDGATLNLANLPTRNLNIRAETVPATIGSVRFGLDATANYRTENGAPYTLAGDSGGNYNPWTPTPGSHTLQVTPFSGANGTGTAGTPLIVRFTVSDTSSTATTIPTPSPTATATKTTAASLTPSSTATRTPTPVGLAVVRLVLVNADTEQDISELTDGATLNLASLPTRNLNVRAETIPVTVGSVRFGLDANPNYRTENGAPYTLAGDTGGNYQPWTPAVDNHILRVTPFSGANATGTAGSARVVNFTVVDGGTATATSTPTLTRTPTTTSTPSSGGGVWQTRASTGLNRQEVSYVEAGGKFYLAGGGTAHQAYNPSTNSWSTVAPLPADLDHIQGVAVNGLIYYIGGLDNWPQPHVSTVYVYNPATNSFSQGAPMPSGRGRGAGGVAVHNGKIYYAGGLSNGTAVAWFDVYDPIANSWAQLPNMPRVRDHFHGAVVGGKFYAIGGRNVAINATTTANDVYNFATGAWSTGLAPLPTARGGFAVALLGSEILVIGGEGGGATFSKVEAYNVSTNSWRTLAPMPTARHGIQAVVCNGGVYIAAGGTVQGGSGPSSAHEVFFLNGPTSCGSGSGTPTPPATSTPAAAVARINAGGPAVTTGGVSWGADRNFSGGKSFTNTQVTSIAGTNDDAIYLNERSATTDLGSFSYAIPVPASGTHTVRLHFAELWFGATGGGPGGSGKRIFSVNFEGGPTELGNFDLYVAGGNTAMTAVVRSFNVVVSDGTLNIAFSATVNQPTISAIEVLSASGSPTLTPTPTSSPVGGFTTISWSTVAAAPLQRSEAAGGVVGGKLYVLGGYPNWSQPLKATSRVDVYDPATNTWTQLGNMPEPITHAGNAVSGSSIYIAGGYVSTSTGEVYGTTKVWRFDTVSRTWNVLPSLPAARGSGALALLNGQLHFFGGNDTSRVERGNHWVLNLTGGTSWISAASLPNPRTHLAGAAVAGKVYAIGGQWGWENTAVCQKSVHVYDPAMNSWREVTSLPTPLSHISASTFAMKGRIIVFGGETAHGSPTASVRAYDPGANTWTPLTSMPSGVTSSVGGEVGGIIYVATGSMTTANRKGVPG